MAIAILPPQNCLGLSPLKSNRNSNPRSGSTSSSSSNPNYNHEDATSSGSRRRRRSPINRPPNRGRSRVGESSAAVTAKNLVMGQVKILKRGERLSSDGQDLDLVLGSTDPDLMQKQVVLAEFKVPNGTTTTTYAGSAAFVASPPPSSVPLPLFLDKNGAATTNLRRLLRLDLD